MLSLSITYYLCIFAELLYPTYASFKAIKSLVVEDDTQWLTYWVVYSFVHTIEATCVFITQWVPLYYEAKLLVILWMIAPQTQGAKLIFIKYIKPLLEKYASRIDPVFARTEEMLNSRVTAQAAKLVEMYGPTVAEQAFKIAKEQAANLQIAAMQAASASQQTKAN